MLTSIRGLTAATLLASTLLAAPAFAQDESDITITGSAALVSEYRFRGVDLSGGDIAAQAGITAKHSSGFYVGTWGSSLDEDSVGYGHTELDLFGGWSGEVAGGVTADVGVIYYAYPNAPAGDFDYIETYAKAGFAVGPATLTLGVAYAPEQDSLGGTDNLYLSTDLGVGIPDTPISLTAHAGYTDGFLTYTGNGKAWDWSLGASAALGGGVSLGAAYIGAEGTGTPAYAFVDDAFVVTLSASF
ncbi:MAG: TorF family putative porin [Alteraurantiacibacter sp.]